MNKNITDRELMEIARKARVNAYAPYSKFKVGAALLCKSGKIFTGCNIENATYAATVCAERTAVTKAVSEGERNFIKIAIVANYKSPCPPCGICRQVLYEFSPNIKIIMANMKGKIRTTPLKKLLPNAFVKK